jgi:hypothetical protein
MPHFVYPLWSAEYDTVCLSHCIKNIPPPISFLKHSTYGAYWYRIIPEYHPGQTPRKRKEYRAWLKDNSGLLFSAYSLDMGWKNISQGLSLASPPMP